MRPVEEHMLEKEGVSRGRRGRKAVPLGICTPDVLQGFESESKLGIPMSVHEAPGPLGEHYFEPLEEF